MTPRTLALSLAFLASAAPRHAAAEGPRAGPYSLEIVDGTGAPLRSFTHQGRTYVLGERGQRYLLRIRNASARRIEVVASVDGRDVVDGEAAAWAKPGYLVEAHGEVTIDGFRLSEAEVAAFRFSSVAASYAARMGDARDVGVIGVAVFPEASARPVPAPVPIPRRPVPDDARGGGVAPRDQSKGRDEVAREAPLLGTPEVASPSARSEAEARPGLGTAFGERRDSAVFQVEFERAGPRPVASLSVRYDDRRGLLALGVDLDGPRWTRRDERRLRETAEPFRSEARYATPPPGWSPGR